MKTKFAILVLALIMSIGNGVAVAQKVDIKGITTIDVNIACQLIVVQGNRPNIEILGEQELVENIKLTVNGSKLSLKNRKEFKNVRKEDVVVKIEIEDLRHLNIGGAVDMKTVKVLRLDDFTLNITGVGNVEMEIDVNKFSLLTSGVANVNLVGKARDVIIINNGVGNITAKNLISEKANVVNSGVGRVNVHATETLNASVSGIGSINYSGKPILTTNVSGLGKIRRF
jgi:hypothetical protein